MDNLTHSMVGAVLGQTGLKRTSGLGMAALVIGANIPDIDASCTLLGTPSLALRRGLTHGPLALLVLPLALTGGLILFDRWQQRRGTRPAARAPLNALWLLALSVIGMLSHLGLDWLNSYGIRLLEPFSSRWFYGDTLFIIDLVMWVVLIGGFIWSRRAEKSGSERWRARGQIILTAACAYIFANGTITGMAERRGHQYLHDHGLEPEMVVANPVPAEFWKREILWRSDNGGYGNYGFSLLDDQVPEYLPIAGTTGMGQARVLAQVQRSKDATAFLFWSRMPLAHFEKDGTLILEDQRFRGNFARGSFRVAVPPS
ncbi:metal-dependent hydrolase [Sphingobium sp. DEHP117]|uniref:metal-dependent hydrolase n=1 Tax=Sphingobium sp. DEHP117 TaxID=2993436 RepID=UPI0027D50CF0|nr:metal-dependent hydrolase [Sphingobium sp. DEHP117]MDQ4420691.1 metal-dependent hydrolase [Sphingobium sp. DEHP117]